ncbi:MAG: DUF3368 domain-containing protein [Chloroflexi bacterium]|nr:DUF3368 domain-containing protein [Chloroflexota bacterium]
MIVVCNTSPLTNLAAIEKFDLLHRLYHQINIANGVWEELNAGGKQWPGQKEVSEANWIARHHVKNHALVTALQRDLDRGEAESIALALEIGADVIILDEREGRHAAERLGIRVVGVIGVLIAAKKGAFIENIHPLLDALRQTAGFYISNRLYSHILEITNEH